MLYSFIIYKDKPHMNNLVRSRGAASHQPNGKAKRRLGKRNEQSNRAEGAKALKRNAARKLLLFLSVVCLSHYTQGAAALCPGLIGVSPSGYNLADTNN